LQLRDERADILDPGLWGMPGGAIEWGETPEQAAVRELHEETGYVAEQIYAVVTQRVELPRQLIDRYVFWAPYDGQQAIHCFEGQEMRWIAFADLNSFPLCPGHGEALARIATLVRGAT